MRHVLWIGGPPGSGKTAVATRLARRHGLRWYSADTRTWAHRDCALRAGNAAALRWEAMAPDERWAVSPGEMLELSLHRERGAMVVHDLEALPRSPLVVAEGSPLPAAAVPDRSRAVWLLPTPEFQRAQLDARRLSRGPRELYVLLAETIEREAAEHSVRTIVVEGLRSIETTAEAVERLFADALAEGSRAETPTERAALLREANEAIVAQVRGYYARPWAEGDPDEVVRTFLCECGDPSCDASVDARAGDALARRVLAAHHTR